MRAKCVNLTIIVMEETPHWEAGWSLAIQENRFPKIIDPQLSSF